MRSDPGLAEKIEQRDSDERLLMVALIVENPELGICLPQAVTDRRRAELESRAA